MIHIRKMMRRSTSIELIFSLLFTWGTVSHYALAADGNINITGNIIANTCTVSPDDKNKGVDMGKIASKQFTEGNSPPAPVLFTISLIDCSDAVSGVSVSFSGQKDVNREDLLALDSGGATGMGIALLDHNQSPIALNSQTTDIPVDPGSASIRLEFYAQYTADGSAINSGAANATTTFNIAYE